MKKLFAIFCLFITIGAHAEVPQWFLYPKQGEYVGVSMLDGNKNTAVVSALMAYAVQNAKKDQQFPDTFPITYTITRQYINNKGEIFVALQTQESATDTLTCEITTMLSRTGSQPNIIEWKERTRCMMRYGKDFAYLLEILHTSEQDFPHIQYMYKGKNVSLIGDGTATTLQYADISHVFPTGLSWRIACNQSLHYAYMRALIGILSYRLRIDYPIAIRNNELIVNVMYNYENMITSETNIK